MKKLPGPAARVYLAALAVVAFLGLAAVLALAFSGRPKADAPRYLLRDTAGKLSLYAADGSGPLAEYDVYTRLLPERDVLALQQGVPVTDEAELEQRLEDYGL